MNEQEITIRNLRAFLAATVWHLNNSKGTKMCIPNAVYEVLEKKCKQFPRDKEMTESEALILAKKK